MERFDAHQRFGDPFDQAVILLKDVIEIFDLPDFNHVDCSDEFQDRVDSSQFGQTGSDSAPSNYMC